MTEEEGKELTKELCENCKVSHTCTIYCHEKHRCSNCGVLIEEEA